VDENLALNVIHNALAQWAEDHWRSPWTINGEKHQRSEPQDYDPTPVCTKCWKPWDQTGNMLDRCPASPGAIVAAALGR
jgi:hypothetical protein